jgi:hypothetical protein
MHPASSTAALPCFISIQHKGLIILGDNIVHYEAIGVLRNWIGLVDRLKSSAVHLAIGELKKQ